MPTKGLPRLLVGKDVKNIAKDYTRRQREYQTLPCGALLGGKML